MMNKYAVVQNQSRCFNEDKIAPISVHFTLRQSTLVTHSWSFSPIHAHLIFPQTHEYTNTHAQVVTTQAL